MSLFAKLTGLDSKPRTKQSDVPILNLEAEEDIDFFGEEAGKENEQEAQKKINEKPAKNNACKKVAKETDNGGWSEEICEEGELSIDVYQEKNDVVVKSTIAGVKPEDIDISVNNDMLTIRGKREHEETIDEKNYYYRECYWGNFSRSIILPCEVKTDKITAKLKNGVLTVRLPKAKTEKKVAIKVVEE